MPKKRPGTPDPARTTDEELWFLPGPPEDTSPADPPWPVADQRPLLRADDWLRAEGRAGRGLVRAAECFARLDARLQASATGGDLIHRLAVHEAADLSWASGVRVTPDRLALYEAMRLSGAEDDRDLATALWVEQRLLRRVGPEAGLSDFLGRRTQPESGLGALAQRPEGAEFEMLTADWQALIESAGDAHPITRAALAMFAWRAMEISPPGADPDAPVIAARIGAEAGRVLPFLPLAMGGGRAVLATGPIQTRLEGWYAGVETACLHALMLLDGVARWEARARRETVHLSGKTPPALIDALRATPVLSAEIAAGLTGASTAGARRNLVWFERRDLVTEITGQGRFRVWAAQV